MPRFKATRKITIVEWVEVKARNSSEAREKFEEDTPDVRILSDQDNGYEVDDLYLIRKPKE